MLIRRRCLGDTCLIMSLTIVAAFLLLIMYNYTNNRHVLELKKHTLRVRDASFPSEITHTDSLLSNERSESSNDNLPEPCTVNSTHPNKESFKNENVFSENRSELASHFPRIMIVGFGKTGTKALFEFLKQHPQLAGRKRESRFFSRHYHHGLNFYLNSLPLPPKNGFVIEKSPDYILNRKVPSRICSSTQSMKIEPSSLKFIVVLRNPVDRSMSEYLEWNFQEQLKGNSPLPHFEKVVIESDTGKINISQKLIKTSCYAQHIRGWFKHFPSNQACFVDGDKLIHRPYQVLHELEECLNLKQFFSETSFVLNSSKQFYCYQDDTTKQLCMTKSKGRTHPHIATEVFEKLVQFFRGCDDELRNMTQKEWCWFSRLYPII